MNHASCATLFFFNVCTLVECRAKKSALTVISVILCQQKTTVFCWQKKQGQKFGNHAERECMM
jgi:hypothetical protein